MNKNEEVDNTPPVLKVKTGIKAGKPLGDAVADVTEATGLDRLAETYTMLTGKDCGCEQRRRLLNAFTV